jgi:protein tyrosine phosphatase
MQRSSHGMSSGGDQDSGKGKPPILVHCSAGCGRTGAFCSIDSVIDMLKQQLAVQHDESRMDISEHEGDCQTSKAEMVDDDGRWMSSTDVDLVEKTVSDFRKQRISMVQSLTQYVLCYETVLEWFAQRRRALSAREADRSDSHG